MSPFIFKILKIGSRTSFESILLPDSGHQAPIEAEACPMPANHAFQATRQQARRNRRHGDNPRFSGGGRLIENLRLLRQGLQPVCHIRWLRLCYETALLVTPQRNAGLLAYRVGTQRDR